MHAPSDAHPPSGNGACNWPSWRSVVYGSSVTIASALMVIAIAGAAGSFIADLAVAGLLFGACGTAVIGWRMAIVKRAQIESTDDDVAAESSTAEPSVKGAD